MAALAPAAWGQNLSDLPAVGFGPTGGSAFQNAVASILPGYTRVNTGLAWDYSGSIGVSLGAANDQNGGSNQNGWSAFSQLDGALNVTGNTRLLQLNLNYEPTLSLFRGATSSNNLAQSGNGSATITLWPETLFLDVRVTTNYASRFGGTQVNSAFISSQEGVQTTSFGFGPRFTHTFGGWGTFSAGYQYGQTLQSGNNNANNVALARGGTVVNPGFGFTGNLGSSQEYANFSTGENLGRWNDTVSLNRNEYGGSGSFAGGSQSDYTNTLKYAATRWLTLIGIIGYNGIDYPGQGYSLSQPMWQLGATVVPNADSSITVLYGRTQGSNTWEVDASYSPGPRTSLALRYTSGVTTGLTQQQQLLQTTTVGPGGILVDRQTGLPVLSSLPLGSQFSVSRVSTLSFSAGYQFMRDTLSAGVSNSEQTTLAPSTSIVGVTTPAGTSTNTVAGTLNWTHDINPSTSLSGSLSYSVSNNGAFLGNPGQSSNLATVQATLSHNFSETVSGSFDYVYTERGGAALRGLPSNFGGSSTQTLLFASLRKSF